MAQRGEAVQPESTGPSDSREAAAGTGYHRPVPRPRLAPVLLLVTLFAAAAVGGTGAFLLARYRAAAVRAAAEKQALLVDARAHLVNDELSRLVAEMTRLSRLADVDLADNNPEPEKRVLRIAVRDTVLFSAAIAILDGQGGLVWAEPHGARPAGGAALVGEAQGRGHAVVWLADHEIDVAAPVAGHGAIVGVVSGRLRDLFGGALQAAARAPGGVVLESPGGPLIAAAGGAAPPALQGDGRGQRWVEDPSHHTWLVTEARLTSAPLVLRLVQPEAVVTAGISGPFRNLLAVVAGAVLLAVAGGGFLAFALGRLERADEELRRSRELAAVGRTSAAIAHEVKNSLNGLSVALDLLAAGRAPPDAARQVHAQARAEIGRLRGVAEDLTLFAAPPRLELRPLDLRGLSRNAAEASADLSAEVGATVELRLPAAPVPVRGDEGKLLSAALNLVRNGLEAMGPGAFGEPLGAPPPARERRLVVGARADRGEAVLEVGDTGAGLAPEVRARLFEPFVSTKRTGTGLGLAIARRVAEAHGGRVEAADRPGGGTLFRIVLPLGGDDPAREDAPPGAGT